MTKAPRTRASAGVQSRVPGARAARDGGRPGPADVRPAAPPKTRNFPLTTPDLTTTIPSVMTDCAIGGQNATAAGRANAISPAFQHSNTPSFHHSNTPSLHHSSSPRATQYSTKLVYFPIPALQQCLFLRLLRLFAANQPKCLSMNTLHEKMGFPGQAQSSLVKPNQGVFLSHRAHYSITSILYHFNRDLAFRGPKQPPIFASFQF